MAFSERQARAFSELVRGGGDDLFSIVGGLIAHYAGPPAMYVVDNHHCKASFSNPASPRSKVQTDPDSLHSSSDIVAVCSSPVAAKRALLRAVLRGAHGRYLKVRLREGFLGLENMPEDMAAQFTKCSQRCGASAAAAAGCETCGEAALIAACRAYIRAERGAERFFDFHHFDDAPSSESSSDESEDMNSVKVLRKTWWEQWHEDGTGQAVVTNCVMYFSGEVWDEVSTWTITRTPRTL